LHKDHTDREREARKSASTQGRNPRLKKRIIILYSHSGTGVAREGRRGDICPFGRTGLVEFRAGKGGGEKAAH